MPTSAAATPSRQAAHAPRLLRAARIIHPFPTVLNVMATAALSFVAASGAPDATVLVRMLAVMFCAQAAIGVTNDLFDRHLDEAAKPWKPLPAGLMPVRIALLMAVGFALGAVVIAATLGPGSFGLAMLGMGCGLAYDARLKRTPLSFVPFVFAIPTLPSWVWVTFDAWTAVLWWIWPIGGLIGLSLHLANTLPDIDDDARHGVRGLAHALGAGRSRVLALSAFAAALALAAAAGLAHDGERWLLAVALLAGAVGLAATLAIHARRHGAVADQAGFALLGVGAAVAATAWLAAVT